MRQGKPLVRAAPDLTDLRGTKPASRAAVSADATQLTRTWWNDETSSPADGDAHAVRTARVRAACTRCRVVYQRADARYSACKCSNNAIVIGIVRVRGAWWYCRIAGRLRPRL